MKKFALRVWIAFTFLMLTACGVLQPGAGSAATAAPVASIGTCDVTYSADYAAQTAVIEGAIKLLKSGKIGADVGAKVVDLMGQAKAAMKKACTSSPPDADALKAARALTQQAGILVGIATQ